VEVSSNFQCQVPLHERKDPYRRLSRDGSAYLESATARWQRSATQLTKAAVAQSETRDKCSTPFSEKKSGDNTIAAVPYAENFRGGQVSSQSCDVTNQLQGKCRRHDHSRGVRGMPSGNFAKLHLKHAFLCILEASFKQYCFYIVLFLGSERVANWPWHSGLPPPYASGSQMLVLKIYISESGGKPFAIQIFWFLTLSV